MKRACLLLIFLAAAAACTPPTNAGAGPSASDAAPPTAPTSPSDTSRPPVASPPEGCTNGFRVQNGSIVVRLSERIGPIPVHEAVIQSDAVAGAFVLSGAGRFDACSVVVADLRKLRSTDSVPGEDVGNRDVHIHEEFLETDLHPYALLTLAGIGGLPDPLPLQGSWSASLTGDLTMHGRTRPVRWDVSATRDGSGLSATASTSIRFEDFGIIRPDQILSLDEGIRVEVKIATVLR